MRLPLLAAALAALAYAGAAQQSPYQDRAAGYGSVFKGPIDCSAQTGGNLNALGCVWLNGSTYVACRGRGTNQNPPHSIYVFDNTDTLVATLNQPADINANSIWGFRDGTTDGQSLIFGCERGIYLLDTAGNYATTIRARNGVLPLRANPIIGTALGLLGTYRALAYDPDGDNGAGSFWAGDLTDALYEVDLDGNVLRQHPNRYFWSFSGLAWDSNSNTLWGNCSPELGDIVEIDPNTGLLTGRAIRRLQDRAVAGGLESVAERNGARAGFMGLLSVDLLGPSRLTGYRVDQWASLRGDGEAVLEAAINGGVTTTRSPVQYRLPGADHLALRFAFARDPSLNGRAAALLLNGGADVFQNGSTPLLPELVALNAASAPAGAVLVLPIALSAASVSLPLPGYPSLSGTGFRIQALYYEPRAGLPLVPTNQVRVLVANAPERVRVVADGLDTFNDDLTKGFFYVDNLADDPIVELTLDWTTSSNPGQATMMFDTDQTGLGDVFFGGNSTAPGCRGTYRRGCDVACGLVYDALCTGPAVTCDANARSGWIASNPGGNAEDYRTLRFRFTNFTQTKRFEFTCDTDGGLGVNGRAMDGLVVRVVTAGGRTLTGELRDNGMRAELTLSAP